MGAASGADRRRAAAAQAAAPPPENWAAYHSGLPPRVDLRLSRCFPYADVPDQGDSVSCVAQAFSAALYCAQVASNGARPLARGGATASWLPDAEQMFSRALAESPDRHKGVSFASVIAHMQSIYGDGLRSAGARVVDNLPNDVLILKLALAAGSTVVAGYQVNPTIQEFHTSAESREAHGFVLPPFWREPLPVSAHAVLLVGYDDAVGCFLARNSWGPSWGADGHFLIRYRDVQDEDAFTDLVAVGPWEPPSPSS